MYSTTATRTVEIGHMYASERMLHLAPGYTGGELIFADNETAKRLRLLAGSVGGGAVRVALLDDVEASDKQSRSIDGHCRWALFTGVSGESLRQGTQADIVRRESEFTAGARQLVNDIRDMELPTDYRLSADGSHVIQGTGKNRLRVPLTGFGTIVDPTYPSCAVHDLAWTRYRQTLAPDVVTFISQSYEVQQRQVAALSHLFPDMAQGTITSVFIDDQQTPVAELQW